MASPQAVRVGLVGCGDISALHLKSMKQAGLEIAALCDIDMGRANKRRDEFASPTASVYPSLDAMLSAQKLDVLGIATPPNVHKEQVMAGLAAGCWVYCEKPVADTLAGIDQIAAAEKSTGRRAYYSTARFRGWDGLLIKRHIDAGQMGDIYRVDLRHFRTRGRPGVDTNLQSRWFAEVRQAIAGITGDMGLYFMDKALYLTDWPKITAVSAMNYREFAGEHSADVPYDVEEHVVILARTERKLTLTFEFANIAHHPFETTASFLGTRGGIRTTDRDKIVYMTETGGPWKSLTQTTEHKDNDGPDTRVYRELARLARSEDVEVIAATTTPQVRVLHEIAQMAFLSAIQRREVTPADIDPTHHLFHNRPV